MQIECRHCRSNNFLFGVLLSLLAIFPAQAHQQPAPPKQTATNTPAPGTKDLSKGERFTFQIAPNLPEFTFKVTPLITSPDQWGNALTLIDKIEVFRGDSDRPVQQLTGCDWEEAEPPPPGANNWLRAEDFNFDGYKDIYVLTHWGATGNAYGCIWLYSPATGHFEHSAEFSELGSYRLKPETKTILTFANGGNAGMVHSAQKYRVENNHLALIWSEDQDWSDERTKFHCIVKERQGTVLVTVRDVWIGAEDGEGPCAPGLFFQPEESEQGPHPSNPPPQKPQSQH